MHPFYFCFNLCTPYITTYDHSDVEYITYFLDEEGGKSICKTGVRNIIGKHRYRYTVKKSLSFFPSPLGSDWFSCISLVYYLHFLFLGFPSLLSPDTSHKNVLFFSNFPTDVRQIILGSPNLILHTQPIAWSGKG